MAECGKCRGAQETGFTLDEGYGTRGPAQWCAGEPQRSIWTGTRMRGVTKRRIVSMRCTRCGFIENYAK